MSNLINTQPIGLLPTPAEWAMLKEQAGMYVRSGLLPSTVNTPEKAIVIAMKGRELGIPPLQAFSHIHVVSGKPAISAELMLALIYRNCPEATIDFVETTDQKCIIKAKRPGASKAVEFKFTIEDAKRAELLGKGPWKQYPAAMIRARCISSMARALFPDAIMGCSYTPEELGEEVNQDGDVTKPKDVTPPPDDNPPPEYFQESEPTIFDPSEYVFIITKNFKGMKIKDVAIKDLEAMNAYWDKELTKSKGIGDAAAEAHFYIKQFLEIDQQHDNLRH